MNLSGHKSEEKVIETIDDMIKELKNGCITTNSKKSYISALALFLVYIYRSDKHLMHKSWIQALDTFSLGLDKNEKKLVKPLKKTIKQLLERGEDKCPPIEFENTRQKTSWSIYYYYKR